MENNRRFIEETFPVKEVGAESSREKHIRHGHISTLHIWWARRPLASSRATNYAALIPAPDNIDEWNKKRQFIIDFSKWENSLDPALIEQARKDILEANGGKPPKVLDPFGGGGAIPLEALRLGCETYSNDYNPVAVLIQKCTLEYPQKYGHVEDEQGDWGELSGSKRKNPLLEDVKKWGQWVLEEAKQEIGRFYPEEEDGSIPVGYIWARTIPCQNPTCGAEIPLMRQYWLAKKAKKKVALYPYVDGGNVEFKVVGDGYEEMPPGFEPGNGTVARAVATCQVCGSVVDANTTRKLFRNGEAGQRMVAVVLHHPKRRGKTYRIASVEDVRIFEEAEEYLKDKREKLMLGWGMDPVPDEPTPEGKGRGAERAFSVRNYGMNAWGDLFNTRQKLALITFTDKVRQVYVKMLAEGTKEEYIKGVVSYLAIGVERSADYNSSLSRWVSHGEFVGNTFTRQALPMVWDYFELNPSSQATGDWNSALGWILRVVDHCSFISSPANVFQSSATNLPYENNFFDSIFTDPPYYDNVPYSYLSDFFYVWLKRTVGHLYPDLFSTPLTPKSNEIVAYSNIEGGFEAGKLFFEDMLKKSFQEIYRVLKPDGIAVIVYAHKSTEGWETLINSLLDSGLIMTGAWPLNTEMQSRLRARESAALASSIYIVTRKMQRQPTGFYNEVHEELKQHLNHKLEQLWQEGIGGGDFFIAAIGSAIEVFGKYEKVMDYEGNIIRADRLLEDVRRIATDYAVRQILHNGFSGEISDLTRFYVLYRWNYGEVKVQFDEARKLAQSCGIDLVVEWNRSGFISKEKEFIRVLGPQDRKLEELEGSSKLIDVLHRVLLLWEKSKRSEMVSLLQESGFGRSEAFYRVAQAVSESLTLESKEKKLLDGFLAGRERLKEEVKKEHVQRRLFE
jgi:adenine-specific DNA methylase